MQHTLARTLTVLILLLTGAPCAHTQDSLQTGSSSGKGGHQPVYLTNPSTWINECYNHLNDLYLSQSESDLDTGALFAHFRDHEIIVKMLKDDFYHNRNSLNIRSVFNLKMRVASILDDIAKWQHKVHKINEALVKRTRDIEQIKFEIAGFRKHSDSIFRENFRDVLTGLSKRQQTGEFVIVGALKKNTAIENRIVDIHTQVYDFYTDIAALLQKQESSLIRRELPPVWKSPPSAYPAGLNDVIRNSFMQTYESIQYYGEISLWRIIIFRGLLFLLCLVPISIFKHEQRKKSIVAGTSLRYLDNSPKAASLVMGMALSPFIFVHPPHAFLEFIFIGITFTVTMLIFKTNPGINKPLVALLIAAFLILYLINFFVTPTFFGRIVYTGSILLIIPLYFAFRQIPAYNLANTRQVRMFIWFLAVHMVVGWFLVVWGNYTLGRAVILSAYSLLIISMILKVAVFTLLDYLGIIAYFFNRHFKTVQINSNFAYAKTKPVLILFSYIFIIIAYLFNMNLFDLVVAGMKNFMMTPRSVGNAEFTIFSIVLFFAAVYLSFILATLIRHTFEPQHEHSVENRSSLGSYLLLLRLLILCVGFTIGILASGLPLTNFAILLGAMGVGIGFGLQNIVSNLISGLIIAFERPFVVGDTLDFENETCKVKEISLRATMVSTTDGADILIPNNNLLSKNLKNWTISNKQRLVEMKVITMHDTVPGEVIEIISRALENQKDIIHGKTAVLFSEINDIGFIFTIKVLITDLASGTSIKSRLLLEIQSALSRNNVRFPEKNQFQRE